MDTMETKSTADTDNSTDVIEPPNKKLKTTDKVETQSNSDSKQDGDGQTELEKPALKPSEAGSVETDINTDMPQNNVMKKEDLHQKPICEADVGITEYISDTKGFSAIIKQRYSDFIVSEINSDGEIVHLTSFDLPTPEKFNTDINVISEEKQQELTEMINSSDHKKSVLLQAGNDKESRTKVHLAIREHFPKLESSTVEADKGVNKLVKVIFPKSKATRDSRWSASRPKYLQFVLYKENKDTMDTINLISKKMRVNTNLFTYAGTKDKRAKTSQAITAFKVEAERIKTLNDIMRNMGFGNFKYVSSPLRLGQSQGNHFTLLLRNVEAEDEEINKSIESLQCHGFINYFGMQRFGTTTISTHDVGRAILHGDYELAVDLLLRPRDGDDDSMIECRQIWKETKDSKKMLEKLPFNRHIEQCVLYVLSKQGSNLFYNALNAIPRNTRLLYVHSYQSYIWNTMTSQRLKLYGLKVVEGDLVLPKNSKIEKDEDVKTVLITQDNITEYSILDVILPLPGYNVTYPQNKVGELYKKILAKDNIEITNMKTKHREYCLSGTYRKIIVKPDNVCHSILYYNDATLQLTLSDLDRLNSVEEPTSVEGGKFKALKLEFSLPPSTYATMALREILKTETSAAYQTTLNVS